MSSEKNPYDGFMDHGGKTGRQWLSEFRTDLRSALDALDAWQETAYSIACNAMGCNFSPGSRLTIPSWFQNLTCIVTLWSDVELHIDPTPICEFLRRLDNFIPRNRLGPNGKIIQYRISMTDEEIEEILWKARDTFDRIFHATLAISDKEQLEKWQESQSVNDPRDKWIYEQCHKLVKYETIKNQLAKKRTWEQIDSIQGIKLAANRYATRHNLSPIPLRQSGRKARKK